MSLYKIVGPNGYVVITGEGGYQEYLKFMKELDKKTITDQMIEDTIKEIDKKHRDSVGGSRFTLTD